MPSAFAVSLMLSIIFCACCTGTRYFAAMRAACETSLATTAGAEGSSSNERQVTSTASRGAKRASAASRRRLPT